MKKGTLKRLLAAMLAIVMVLGMIACTPKQPTDPTNGDDPTGTNPSQPVSTGITFPLEKEVTFTIAYRHSKDLDASVLENCAFWNELYERTNVKINLVQLPATDTMTKLNAMFMSNTKIDAIFSSFMKDADINQLVASDLLQPITKYVKDANLMTNFHNRVLSESPTTLGTITYPDGEIYALPRYDGLEASYLESPMFINKTWVEKAGWKVEDIKTIEDLETVLTYFAEHDMNGNGVDDEIPYMVKQGHSHTSFEAFMGLYGIATKNGTYENYVYVEDGKVVFAPTTQGFKDAITKLNEWYEKGIVWNEAFTSTSETWTAKFKSETPVIGMYTHSGMIPLGNDEYVVLTPVKVEGYEANWYVHPGSKGVRNQFIVTEQCENTDILMAWLDQFYALEDGWRWLYGDAGDGRYVIENGTYTMLNWKADQVEKERIESEFPVCSMLGYVSAFTKSDYAEGKLTLTATQVMVQDAYDQYRPWLNDEIWPRPYFTDDDTTRLSELRTDIFNLVNMKMADWIVGNSSINSDWNDYCSQLNKIGVEELVTIMQGAYDTYLAGQE